MRLISFNYTQQAETIVTASSSNANFPVSNIKHEHRSKEWRSSGHFVIDSSNKTIVFSEGGGDLTATLTEGTYSAATLATEIQSKMNTAGANEYKVTYAENSGIWTLAANVSFTLKATGTALSTIGFNAVERTGDELDGVQPAIHTSEYIQLDLRTTEEINSVVLLWGKGQYNLSSDAEIRVQASATSNFATTGVDQVLTFNNDFETASHYFTESQSFRYWRIVITDPNNPLCYVNLGVIVLGQHEELDNPDNGFNFSLDDNSRITRTEYGQEYADIYPITASLSIDFSVMEYEIAEALILFYLRVGTRTPIYIALDPEGTVFDKDCFSIYGKFTGSLGTNHNFHKVFNSGLKIREIN